MIQSRVSLYNDTPAAAVTPSLQDLQLRDSRSLHSPQPFMTRAVTRGPSLGGAGRPFLELNGTNGGDPAEEVNAVSLYGAGNTWFADDGFGTTYEITDERRTTLWYAGTLCQSKEARGEGGNQPSESEVWNAPCHISLPPGSYLWRVHGNLDPNKRDVGWEFCGARGSVQTQLHFKIDENKLCLAGEHVFSIDVKDHDRQREQILLASGGGELHEVTFLGSLDMIGLNSVVLLPAEDELLQDAIATVLAQPRLIASRHTFVNVTVLSWQQALPPDTTFATALFSRGSGKRPEALIDRMTFTAVLTAEDFGADGASTEDLRELTANVRRYLGFAVETGYFLSILLDAVRATPSGGSPLMTVTRMRLVELDLLQEEALDRETEESGWIASIASRADVAVLVALVIGTVVGVAVAVAVASSRSNAARNKMRANARHHGLLSLQKDKNRNVLVDLFASFTDYIRQSSSSVSALKSFRLHSP